MISMKHMPYVVCYMEGINKIIELNLVTDFGVDVTNNRLTGDSPTTVSLHIDIIESTCTRWYQQYINDQQLIVLNSLYTYDYEVIYVSIFPTPYILPKTDSYGNYLNNKKPHNISNIKSNHEFI